MNNKRFRQRQPINSIMTKECFSDDMSSGVVHTRWGMVSVKQGIHPVVRDKPWVISFSTSIKEHGEMYCYHNTKFRENPYTSQGLMMMATKWRKAIAKERILREINYLTKMADRLK